MSIVFLNFTFSINIMYIFEILQKKNNHKRNISRQNQLFNKSIYFLKKNDIL